MVVGGIAVAVMLAVAAWRQQRAETPAIPAPGGEERERPGQDQSSPSGNAGDILFLEPAGRQGRSRSAVIEHPLVDVVSVRVSWAEVEPQRGEFTFDSLDEQIAAAHGARKSVNLRFSPYGQVRGNDATPAWVFEQVPAIAFTSRKERRGNVKIPTVWDARFLPAYESFVAAVADRYANDSRVRYVQIGVGHLGFLTAQPSPEGSEAFIAAGWTIAVWERYAIAVTDLYARRFPASQLLLTFTPSFVRGEKLVDHLDVGKRIARHAAQRGIWLLFKGIDPEPTRLSIVGFAEIMRDLTAQKFPGLTFGFGDDWPLYGQTGSVFRTSADFAASVQHVIDAWEASGKAYRVFLVLHDVEVSAAEPGNPRYNQEVADALNVFLAKVGR